MRLIRLVTENAHKNGIWVGICGELLERVGVDRNRLNAYPHELSGGIQGSLLQLLHRM